MNKKVAGLTLERKNDKNDSEKEDYKELKREIDFYKKLTKAFDYCFDEVYITDGQGYTIFVSKACEKFYGVKSEKMVGKHVSFLEKEGMFSQSVTRKVLNKKEQITIRQTTKKGKKLLVTGVPIFDENNIIEMVITISRDITEMSSLKDKLAEIEELSNMYLLEIERLKTGQSYTQEIVSESDQMKEILEIVKKIAKVDSTVLLEGESGVGKGVIASQIHNLSKRANNSYISINCGAIPVNLIESELFGYEPGAFTGASKEGKKGLFEIAAGGTVFLDEISEIPHSLQVKLLQVIQDKKFKRVGGNKDISIDVRIITATNQDIKKLVREGNFREDLFYRLNVIPIWIPPLRHRREDIIPLVKQFLKKFNDSYKFKKKFSDGVINYLYNYDWPGNVRELENLIERIIVTSEADYIDTCHLPNHILNSDNTENKEVYVSDICTLKQATEEMERQLIEKAYAKYKNTYKIAKALQVNQSTIVRKIHKYLGKK